MAHVRKDTLTMISEWAKHLRPLGKRFVSKGERLAAKKQIKAEIEAEAEEPVSLGLSNDPKEMSDLRAEKGTSVIPWGCYCYNDKICPYYDTDPTKPAQQYGYCWYLRIGDWEVKGTFLLWDQCKECGVRDEEIAPEGCANIEDEREEPQSMSMP